MTPTLRDARRLIGVSVAGRSDDTAAEDTAEKAPVEKGNVLFSPMGPLARDELEDFG